MNFNELNIITPILKALDKEKYEIPTPIQEQTIPSILEGRDLLGSAQTGTGKTAAYAIPTIQLLNEEITTTNRKIRALVLTPTRELAQQVFESFRTYGQFTKLRYSVIYGGVSQRRQEEKLKAGVDIVIATPGRLNDLMNQKRIDLRHVEILVLDEADRMLDMGFIIDVKKIIEVIPDKKQTLFFSATMPKEIIELSNSILVDPVEVALIPKDNNIKNINQMVYYVSKANKLGLLVELLKNESITSALVFTRTKIGADRLVQNLSKENISSIAIHGDKTQFNRQQALQKFKKGAVRVLVATDVASRGIDIDELSHVINYDVPEEAETYIHRIGRTGRAGLSGTAITMCDISEKSHFKSIEKLIGMKVREIKEHPYAIKPKVVTPKASASRSSSFPKPNKDKGRSRNRSQKSYSKQKSSNRNNYK